MRRLLKFQSFRLQLVLLSAFCVAVTGLGAGVALIALRGSGNALELCISTAAGGVLALGLAAVMLGRLLRPLHQLRGDMGRLVGGVLPATASSPLPNRDLRDLRQSFDRVVAHLSQARTERECSEKNLRQRTNTVNRLLDFSQIIAGAGQLHQVFAALAHFLRTELALAELVILSHAPEAAPATQMRARWPEPPTAPDAGERAGVELDGSSCPCLRQNQPRLFRPDEDLVRCAIEAPAALSQASPAYCLPFNVGRKIQVLAHAPAP